jgi:predicted DCC family thiol-disulfide oxidoreductase YuxK
LPAENCPAPVVANVVPENSGNQSTDAGEAPTAAPRPQLIYDGDCGFCSYWARYWEKLTGDKVEYRPYQQVAAQYPAIPEAEFKRAVQFIAPNGSRASAAEASFATLSHAPDKGFWLALYRRMRGFAAVSEWAYAFVAARRPAFHRASLLLWGKNHEPPRYEIISFLFLRLFGLIALSAFVSFAVQAQGLIGSRGILPLADLVDALARVGPQRFVLMPMVFWLNDSDAAIQVVCWAGAGLSLMLIFNLLPRVSLVLIYALYLSLFYAGQTFMSFQWDTFLLETTIVALLMSFAPTTGVWLARWLLFRFMFMSGVVKLISDDPNWWNLTALSYHFLTQPLPTPLAWYAAGLPPGPLKVASGAVFVVELGLPFLIFCPRRLRFVSAFGIFLLQCCILLTGNYNWFNLQTVLLCLPLIDDAALRGTAPRRLFGFLKTRASHQAPQRAVRVIVDALALLMVFLSLIQMDLRFGGSPPEAAVAIEGWFEPLHLVSPYGLFAVMTTARDEIVIQGSNDGVEWRDYEFRYKPGDIMRRPRWNVPHQPRLDWQMWFAALDDPQRVPWFSRFLVRLLENEPSVTALLETNPFPDKPPNYVRAQFYDYTYAGGAEDAAGRWWDRRLLGLYFPVAHLKAQ